jgi:hypothetical protein
LSALRTGSFYLHIHFLEAESILEPQCSRSIKSLKNLKDAIENRNRDFLGCTAVPKPAKLPRVTVFNFVLYIMPLCCDFSRIWIRKVEEEKNIKEKQ